MKIHYTLQEQWEWVKPVWRILLTVGLLQFIGGCTAVFIAKSGHLMVDFWLGGALSTLPGFILGLFWQASYRQESVKEHIFVIIFMGFLSLSLTLAVFFMPLDQLAN